jgi:ring-1,2-phenylacetyl-CoA epoxidase subunit PaaE
LTVTATIARAQFHPLRVARVDALCADAAAVTFDVPVELADAYAHRAGQSLTLRRVIDGREERRSYSISSPEGAPLRIGVREVAGGALSGWLVHRVRAGDTIDVLPPSGSFTPDVEAADRHMLLAAGSGITPVLSIAGSLLAGSATEVTLVYGNRRTATVMFSDEVADLKDAHPTRLRLLHVLSREPQEVELATGRLDAAKLRVLLPALGEVSRIDHWWLCGPFGMITDAIEVLHAAGVPAERIHRELFWVGEDPPVEVTHVEAAVVDGAAVTVILDGRATTFRLPAGVAVLDGAQKVRPDLPFACKGGVCGTCRARLVAGEATMRRNYALEPAEVAAGQVLTCQTHPVSDAITVDFDV